MATPKKVVSRRFIVESPVKNFVGIGAGGVQFAYGKAEVNEGWVLEWYREKGYKITEIVDKKAAADASKTPDQDASKTPDQTA